MIFDYDKFYGIDPEEEEEEETLLERLVREDKSFSEIYLHPKQPPLNGALPYWRWRAEGEEAMEECLEHRLEVLSPATASTYKLAVECGADAIYFGYGSLNARANCDNIADKETLKEVVDYCHLHNVKAYLALNIMLKEKEVSIARKQVIEAEEAGIDAFIISDLALLPIIRRYSKAEVHASTQMGIHNRAGADFARRLGFDRIVLSRESTEKDLDDVMKKVKIDIEVFGHGALCTGFSGACLLSSMLTGKSGNRGRCRQFCRMKYSCYLNGVKTDTSYLLSSKDICLAPYFVDMSRKGVKSYKIEGRMKSAEYIGGVTTIYSKVRDDAIYEAEFENALLTLFNRGNFCRGYWEGSDIIYNIMPNHIGLLVGYVSEKSHKNIVILRCCERLKKGDCLKLVHENKDIGGLEIMCETAVEEDTGMFVYKAYTKCDAQIYDHVYLTKTTGIIEEPRRIITEVAVRLVAGEHPYVLAVCDYGYIEYYGEDRIEPAINQPLNEKFVADCISKTGDTDFEFIVVKVVTENAFMTHRQLNELRREVIAAFSEVLKKGYKRPEKKHYKRQDEVDKIEGDFIELSDIRQYTPLVRKNVKNIVYSPLVYDRNECVKFYEKVKEEGENRVFIKFPIFIPAQYVWLSEELLKIYDGVIANNIGAMFQSLYQGKLAVAGWNMNVANTKNPYLKFTHQTIVSTELTADELRDFNGCLVYAFGRLPLMYLNHCPKKVNGVQCENCESIKTISYRDENCEYPIITKKIRDYCQHELLNSAITNLGNMCPNNYKYLDFSSFSPEETEQYLTDYFYGENIKEPKNFNHLHLRRGVE